MNKATAPSVPLMVEA